MGQEVRDASEGQGGVDARLRGRQGRGAAAVGGAGREGRVQAGPGGSQSAAGAARRLETFLTDPEVFSDKGGRRFLPGEEVEADAIGGPPLVAVEEPDWEKHEDVALPAPSGPSFEDAAGKTGSSLKQSAG
jgi:hypothetical protein